MNKLYDKIVRFLELGILSAILAMLPLSCGTSKGALENQISALEKELIRLKADKANLSAHSNSLDDELLVLKKKLNRCNDQDAPALPVVRLTPGSVVKDQAHEVQAPIKPRKKSSPSIKAIDDGKRPKLVLVGRSQRSYLVGQSGNPRISSEPNKFDDLGPENLGVIPVNEDVASGKMDRFQAAYRFYTNKQYEAALTEFSTFLSDNPNHAYADNSIFWRGECYLAMNNFLKAIGEFERLARRYPSSEKIPSGLYRIGFAYDQLRDQTKALEYYFEVVEKFPESDAARRASRRVSQIESKGQRMGGYMPTAAKR